MKKLLLSLSLVLVGLSVNAQEAGKMWVGGSVNVWSQKVGSEDRVTTAKVLPEFGYMLSDKLGIGAEIGYVHKQGLGVAADFGGSLLNGVKVAPFVRYNVISSDLGGLFIDGGVGYTFGKAKGAEDNYNEFEVGLKPGVSVNIASNLSLIGKFGFLGYEHAKEGDAKVSSYGLKFNMDQMQIGVIYKF